MPNGHGSPFLGAPIFCVILFAVLAARCVLAIPISASTVTGARAGRLLGKFSAAAR